jgi:hypothetical protein
MKLLKYKGNDLWSVAVGVPMPARKMMFLLNKIGVKIPGFGIYALSFNSKEFGDRIIYVGKYAGSIDSAQSGDVRERWFKHFGSATLLLRNFKMSSSKNYFYHKNKAQLFFANDPEFHKAAEDSFLNIDEDSLKQMVFIKGADLQISKNRLGFAIQNLKEFQNHKFDDALEVMELLSRFTFYYWKIEAPSITTKSMIDKLLTGSHKKGGCESDILSEYKHRLPMNKEYTPSDQTNKDFYHYNPCELISTAGKDFNDFDKFITDKINFYFPRISMGN